MLIKKPAHVAFVEHGKVKRRKRNVLTRSNGHHAVHDPGDGRSEGTNVSAAGRHSPDIPRNFLNPIFTVNLLAPVYGRDAAED